uniref:Glycosyltransferases n=1 Tax=Aegilops tauschii TaxID=37682 RepID=M8BIU3_AEGTA
MDGVVVFADENGILRTELFDEAQKVKSVGAVPVGILGEDEGTKESFLQAPACDEAGKLGTAERPEWVRDLDAVDGGAHLDSPLALVTDAGQVEPLARCAQAALAWSLRSDALHEVKFPHECRPLASLSSNSGLELEAANGGNLMLL